MTTTSASVLTLRPAISGSRLGLGLALLSAASFGTSGSFARSLTAAGWSPAAAVVARIGVAAILLAVPGFLALRGRWRALRDSGAIIEPSW